METRNTLRNFKFLQLLIVIHLTNYLLRAVTSLCEHFIDQLFC